MTSPEPNTDPTPVWSGFGRALGIGSLTATVGIAVVALVLGRTIDKWLVLLAALPMLGALALWRPKWFERLVLAIADRLPSVDFKKTPPADPPA